MDFDIPCKCGKQHSVNEGSAGVTFPCECGQTVTVPSLSVLRENAGMSAVRVTAAAVVSKAVAEGALPLPECVSCGNAQTSPIELETICEQSWSKRTGGGFFLWPGFLFGGMSLFSHSDEVVEIHGRDRATATPLSVCSSCRPMFVETAKTPLSVLIWLLLIASPVSFLAFAGAPIQWYHLLAAAVLVRALQVLLYNRWYARVMNSLMSVPEYKALFEEFPDATVYVD